MWALKNLLVFIHSPDLKNVKESDSDASCMIPANQELEVDV